MNFFVGIFSGLILVVMFGLAALRFIQRLFDVILLYIVSPVSVATIPLDDGARFKIWREMLISKVLSAYGIVFAMNLFFLIIPQVNRIQFYDNGFQNGLIGLLFVIGGAFAVTKAYMVIAQLTGSNAGAQEAQQTMAGISSGIRMARGAVRLAAGAVGQVIGGSDFRSNLRRGMGFGESVDASIHSTRNQRIADGKDGQGKSKEDKEKKADGNTGGAIRAVEERSAFSYSSDSRQTYSADGEARTENGQGLFADKDGCQPYASDSDNKVRYDDGQTANGNTQHSDRDGMKERNAAHIAGGVGRLATLPVGVLKDLVQGGLITTGKNIWPRLRNVAAGRGAINRAEVIPKQFKDGSSAIIQTAAAVNSEKNKTQKNDGGAR
jgi:hypothetical protein